MIGRETSNRQDDGECTNLDKLLNNIASISSAPRISMASEQKSITSPIVTSSDNEDISIFQFISSTLSPSSRRAYSSVSVASLSSIVSNFETFFGGDQTLEFMFKHERPNPSEDHTVIITVRLAIFQCT